MSTPTLQRTPFLTAVWVIAKREITTRLASKGFVIPTAIVLAVIIMGSVLGPRVTDMFSSTDQVAVTQETQPVIGALGDGYVTQVVASDYADEQDATVLDVDYEGPT